MSKKIFSIAVVLGFLLSIVYMVCQANNADGGEQLVDIYVEQTSEEKEILESTKDTEDLDELMIAQGNLLGIFTTIQERMIVESYAEIMKRTGDENATDIYKDFYGSAYIDGKELVVCITDEGSPTDFGEDIVNNDSVKFKRVEYSYNQILEVQKEIGDRYEEYYAEYKDTDTPEFELLSSIVGIGTSVEKNDVIIHIVKLTEEKKDTFNRLFGEYDIIRFENQEQGVSFELETQKIAVG